MIDFTPLFEAIITLLAAVITAYVVPWIKTRYSEEQLNKIKSVVEIAVYAAEKAYGAGNGDKKLEYVETVLQTYNIQVDTVRLRVLVDSVIKKMENEEASGVIVVNNGTEG